MIAAPWHQTVSCVHAAGMALHRSWEGLRWRMQARTASLQSSHAAPETPWPVTQSAPDVINTSRYATFCPRVCGPQPAICALS
jgi:hypothetical protein